jgi:hypothetical protein
MQQKFTFVAAALLAAVPVLADTFVESFDGGSNVGGWTFGAPFETIEADGGNPGAHLHADGLDTYAPYARTTLGEESVFTGDFRARNVTGLGIDLRTYYVDFSAAERPLALLLYHDNDTPGDVSDDWAAYTLGADAPTPADGWLSYDYGIPSQAPDLPAGWSWLDVGGSSPAFDWQELITDVDAVMFAYGDPTWFYIFQMWTLGLDNPRLTSGSVATAPATLGEIKALFR